MRKSFVLHVLDWERVKKCLREENYLYKSEIMFSKGDSIISTHDNFKEAIKFAEFKEESGEKVVKFKCWIYEENLDGLT